MFTDMEKTLTLAGRQAAQSSRQIWIWENAGQLMSGVALPRGKKLVARVFGPGDYILENE